MPSSNRPSADDQHDRSLTSHTAAVVAVHLGPEVRNRASAWCEIIVAVHRAGMLPDEAMYEASIAFAAATVDAGMVARRALAHVDGSLGLAVTGGLSAAARATILRDVRDVRGVAVRFDQPTPVETDLERALLAGDLTTANRIALREHPFTGSIGGLLARLEPERLQDHPLLALRVAASMLSREQTRARADVYFQIAARSRAGIDELTDPVTRAVAHALMSVALRRAGDVNRMLDHTRKALEVLEPRALARQTTGEESEPVAMGLDQAGTSLYLSGDSLGARRAFEALSVHAAAARLPHRANRAHALLALLDAIEGRMNAVEQRLARIDPSAWPDGWDGAHLAKPMHIAKAALLTSRADPMGALEELRLVEADYASTDFWGPMHVMRVVAAGLAEDDELMARFLRDAEQHPGPHLPGTVTSMDLAHAIVSGLAPHIAPPRPPYTALSDAAKAISALALVRVRRTAASEVVAAITTAVPLARIFVLLIRFLSAEEQDRAAAAAEVAALANHHGLWSPFAMLTASERELLRELAPAGALAEFDRYRTRALSGQADVVLTEGEQRVLAALATGASRPQIARDLHLSLNTVKSHLRSLYMKLSATTRDQALQRALSLGLVNMPR